MVLHMQYPYVDIHTALYIYYTWFNTFEYFKMHCNVSQWLVTHLQRVQWMKWRYASWEMIYFTAFSFGCTATFFQTWIRATCLTKLSKQTTRQPSISVTIKDYRQIIIIVATKYSEKWLYLYAYCLRSIFYCCSLITHFRKTNSMAKVTTRASAIVTKIITSLAVKGTLATPQLL